MPGVKPPAVIAPRGGDEELTIEELKQISLFASVDLSRLKLEEFPGTLVLRHFRKGEEICRQNDPGYTAFYPLTARDLLDLRESQLHSATDKSRARRWEAEAEALRAAANARVEELPRVASALRAAPTPQHPGLWGFLRRLAGGATGASGRTAVQAGAIVEGQLFGEMSCLYRTPRTATVVADRDCYMLELLRNILDKMYANKAFKEQLDRLYRRRVLELQLRALPLFRDLGPEQYELLREQAELEEFEPGDVIFDEHGPPDSMYIVRSGFVKVLKGASPLLGPDSVLDAPGLFDALRGAGAEAPGPRRKVWDLMGDGPARAAIQKTAPGTAPADDDKKTVLYALNELIKQPKLSAAPEFKALLEASGWAAEAKKLGSARKWSAYEQVGRFNRRLLEAVFPGVLVAFGPTSATTRILAYCSEGDLIGEMGLLMNEPRSATCIAYDHYGEGKLINGRVEAVRIRKELFDKLRQASPALEEKVGQLVRQRAEATRAAMRLPSWESAGSPSLLPQYNELSLIQGQKLMLIDLDRCTRCDKCVEACVRSHTDGRSRLFLDGPRFQYRDASGPKNYLVPASCRQCKDPVCLVGCPVGSIHKGDNGQIVIENWCIGCSRCAEQCPYGSIQMHATGILPRGARGWQHRRGSGPWEEGQTPFRRDRAFRARYDGPEPVEFRHTFDLSAEQCRDTRSFHLQVHSQAKEALAFVNGQPVTLQAVKGKDKGEEWNLEARLSLAGGEDGGLQPVLRAGPNEVTVRLSPEGKDGDVLLNLGLYAYSMPTVPQSLSDNVSQELVMNTAVVCDMCSEQFGHQPACVNACPHEAALRVEAQSFFR